MLFSASAVGLCGSQSLRPSCEATLRQEGRLCRHHLHFGLHILQQFMEMRDSDTVSTDSENRDQRGGLSTQCPPKKIPSQFSLYTKISEGPPLMPLHNPFLVPSFTPFFCSPFPPVFHSFYLFFIKQSRERQPHGRVSYTRNYYFYAFPLRVHSSTIHTFVGIFFL